MHFDQSSQLGARRRGVSPDSHAPQSNQNLVLPGALDGITILRYVHIYRDRASGGIEQQLRLLNHGLLQRHRLTFLQTHLLRDGQSPTIEVEEIGKGRIIWVPTYIRETDSAASDLLSRANFLVKKSFILRRELGCTFSDAAASSVVALFRHHGGHLRYRFTIISDHLDLLLKTHNVDLLLMHWMSYDTNHLIERTISMDIPFAIINHFDNRRFTFPEMKKWIPQAAAIGSVSGQGLPEDLRDRCVNLADAIDTDFFNVRHARPLKQDARPILLHPARIQIDKGHQDLVHAAQTLRAAGIDFILYFVGAVDSQSIRREIQNLVESAGLTAHAIFLGEKSRVEMRDLFAASSMVLLPSRSEGLPRVLLEAQAMGKPVVAYNCGGISEAFLPNESGFLVDSGDVESLTDRIAFLLKDERSRLNFGRAGREYVKRRFSLAALIERHEAFFRDSLSHSLR